jgi:hypothetical protein
MFEEKKLIEKAGKYSHILYLSILRISAYIYPKVN